MHKVTATPGMPQTLQLPPQLPRLQLSKQEKANAGTAKRTAPMDSARSKGSAMSNRQAGRGAETSAKSPAKKQMNSETPQRSDRPHSTLPVSIVQPVAGQSRLKVLKFYRCLLSEYRDAQRLASISLQLSRCLNTLLDIDCVDQPDCSKSQKLLRELFSMINIVIYPQKVRLTGSKTTDDPQKE